MKSYWYSFGLVLAILVLCFLCPVQAAPPDASVNAVPLLLWSGSTGSTEPMSDNAAKVSCSGDGKYVAVGYGVGIVEFRDRQGAMLWRWQSPHPYYTVWKIAVSRNGEYTGVILNDPLQDHPGWLCYFDRAGNLLWSKSMKGPFGFVALSGNGNVIALTDGERISFFTSTGELAGTTVLEGFPWAVGLSDDGATAGISTGYDRGYIYAVGTNGTVLWSSPGGQHGLSVAITGDGRYLAGTASSRLRLFTISGDRLWDFNSSPEFTGVAVSSDGAYIAASSQYYLRLFNRSGAELWQYEVPSLPTRPGPYIGQLSMSADGSSISVTTEGNRTLFFDREGNLLWQNESPDQVVSTSLARNGKYLAIGTEQEFSYFDTGIALPADETVPIVVATTPAKAPVRTPTHPTPVSAVVVITGICSGMLLCEAKRKR